MFDISKQDAEINFRNHWKQHIINLQYQYFIIYRQLPSLNEYIKELDRSRYHGNKFKKSVEQDILNCMHIANLEPLEDRPCVIHIDWHESTRKRDTDNIQSATKYILDALQKGGILKNDNHKYVKQISHNIIHGNQDAVVVYMILGDNVKNL